jgi:poly(hydroxyalkanoate) depolymerase family esterase
MNWMCKIAVLFAFFTFTNTCFGEEKMEETIFFGENPGNLRMFHFFPDSNFTKKRKLVVVLHGCSQKAEDIANLTGWNKLAKSNDFIVLYPQQKFVNNPNLCFNWFSKEDTDKGKGEIHSIQEMIKHGIKNWNIDTKNIYTVGFSAGAAMSVALLAAYPEVFSGGASFAGGPYQMAQKAIEGGKAMLGNFERPSDELRDLVKAQNPTFAGEYPRLLVFQGLDDKIVAPKNSYLLVNQWLKLYESELIPTTFQPLENFPDIQKTTYLNTTGDTRIIFYEVKKLGHKLLIDPGENENQGGKNSIFSVEKGFHSTYYVAKDLKIIQ